MQKKLIVTAIGAFGLGALVGWAVTADRVDRLLDKTERNIFFLEKRANYLEGVLNAGNALQERMIIEGEANEDQLEIPLDSNGIDILPYEDDDVIPEGETPEQTRSNLQKLIDSYQADPAAQEEFTNLAMHAEEYDKVPPYVISKTDYAWDEEGEHHEKITLTYFPRNRVLLDDEEDPIEDIAGMVGWRSLSQFGGESEDPDVVFVRNRRLMTDFEIVKDDDSQLPLHVKYGMGKEEFRTNKAAGTLKLRREDE